VLASNVVIVRSRHFLMSWRLY